MFILLKHRVVKLIEKLPLIQVFIYNNLQYFKFLFPHEKDYYALKIIFKKNENRAFLDIGGNIGLSTIGFRELGFKSNKIFIFEPDKFLVNRYINKIKIKYSHIFVYSFGLSNRSQKKKLFRAFYKKIFFHFNNSFNLTYLKQKLFDNYGNKSKKFHIKSTILDLKKFDNIGFKHKSCFVKIDVEGFDEYVLYGMKNFIIKNNPTILVEYNKCNFFKIYDLLKKKYNVYYYNFNRNKLKKLLTIDIFKLIRGQILDSEFNKNSVNIFFIQKDLKKII